MSKYCHYCGAELNDDVYILYEYEDEYYCSECILNKMIEDGIIKQVVTEEYDGKQNN